MRYLPIAALAGAALVSACAMTTDDMHLSAREKGTLEEKLPYQEVRTEITIAMARCYPERGMPSAYTYYRATELDEHRLTRIEGIFGTMMGERVTLSVDVRATPEGASVNYYSNYFGLISSKSVRPVLQKWIDGDHDCGR